MPEFLAENNPCGQQILNLVSCGNAIIAELLRLKDYVPSVFRLDCKADQVKYADIIFDFTYFKCPEAHEAKIEKNTDLQDIDEEFRENNMKVITRFYFAFESIYQYICNLNGFLSELNDGVFIHHTLDSIIQDAEGKQLLCEALYIYGVMLLVVDMHIPGIIRERLLVSYHRYSPQRAHGDGHIDEVCKLLRSTGLIECNAKRPNGYPEEYFKRIPIDENYVEVILGQLRLDDIYNQVSAYSHPGQRSAALANQAAMLYVCLFFAPNTLQSQTAVMREIVDKFFPDNWIISIYMGITINLIDSWEPYRAAKLALNNTLEICNIKDISIKAGKNVKNLIVQTRNSLKEGALTEQILLVHPERILNMIRKCNVALRWVMMHTMPCTISCDLNKKCRQIKDQVVTDSDLNTLEFFELLLNTAQLEYKVKEMYKKIMTEKITKWTKHKEDAISRLNELSEVFSGDTPLMRIEKNDSLKFWFKEISSQIDTLKIDDIHTSVHKLGQLIHALDEVQGFHLLDSSAQVKQYLVETESSLRQMISIINIKEDLLITLQIVGDLSYAWNGIEHFTNIMQDGIKKDPSLVIKLRATFLKLASALEIPLLRINQAHSGDLVSVSQYYSNELVNYVRKVLQIIPRTMFQLMAKIIHINTSILHELPTRLDKSRLKDYAKFDERMEIAKLTHSVSILTQGILTMQTTLVGVISIDPKQLLEDGIRKELVLNISDALHKGLIFSAKPKQDELSTKLDTLVDIISGCRRSFEYIQDYVNINGLKIWQEEVARIIGYNVEQECNSFLRNKVQDWQSVYQSQTIPIPKFPSVDANSINFIGRLAREICRITDPKTTVYVDLSIAWFDFKTHKELLNIKLFSKITQSIGPAGLTGLDHLYSFMIVTELQTFFNSIRKKILQNQSWTDMLNSFENDVKPYNKNVPNPAKLYASYTNRATKVWPQILDWVLKVGQMQLLRKHIAYELNISCKFNSKNLESSLRTMNQAVMCEIKEHMKDPNKPMPPGELLHELGRYLQWAGLTEPFAQIYITTKNSSSFADLLFLFLIVHIPKFTYHKNIGGLMVRKIADHIDALPLICGVQTILRQCHAEIKNKFLALMGQYVLSFITHGLSARSSEFPQEAITTLHFLKIFIKHASIPKKELYEYIPEAIFSQYEYLGTKV